jgi:hypothetical protein
MLGSCKITPEKWFDDIYLFTLKSKIANEIIYEIDAKN